MICVQKKPEIITKLLSPSRAFFRHVIKQQQTSDIIVLYEIIQGGFSLVSPSNVENQFFYDIFRIVDPDSAQGQQFADEMELLTQRLLGENYDPAIHTYRFLLSDEAEPNGFTIPSGKPPVIVLTKGLLEEVNSLDELASVLAHELGHNYAYQKLGDHDNSKAEEAGADGYQMKLLIDAGFNAKAGENFLNRLHAQEHKSTLLERAKLAMIDVHPLTENRVSILSKARIALNRGGFTTERADTSMPDAMLANARSAVFDSETEIFQRAKHDGFAAMGTAAKLNWLVERAEEVSQLSKKGQEGGARKHYRGQILSLYKQISVVNQPEHHPRYEAAFNQLLATGLWNASEPNRFIGHTSPALDL